jgi:predicted transcriptional regulator
MTIEDFSKEFTRLFRLEQRRSGLEVQEYADKIGIPRTTMYDILSGQRGQNLKKSIEFLEIIGYEINFEFKKKQQ